MEGADPLDPWSTYGTDREKIEKLIQEDPSLGELFDPQLPYLKGEAVWAVREEMARTIEDILSRRTRILLLDAKLAIKVAPLVASLLAKELGKGKEWEESQVKAFTKLAQNYLV